MCMRVLRMEIDSFDSLKMYVHIGNVKQWVERSTHESNVRLIIRLMGLKYLWVESILAVKMKRAPGGGCEYSLIFDFF